MLEVRGRAGGTCLTGTLYERGERPPSFRGAPDEGAPYVWLCDEFYAVESGGQVQRIDDREVRVAFERPLPRGFEDRERAVSLAKEHILTQFQRIGVERAAVTLAVERTPQ